MKTHLTITYKNSKAKKVKRGGVLCARCTQRGPALLTNAFVARSSFQARLDPPGLHTMRLNATFNFPYSGVSRGKSMSPQGGASRSMLRHRRYSVSPSPMLAPSAVLEAAERDLATDLSVLVSAT